MTMDFAHTHTYTPPYACLSCCVFLHQLLVNPIKTFSILWESQHLAVLALVFFIVHSMQGVYEQVRGSQWLVGWVATCPLSSPSSPPPSHDPLCVLERTQFQYIDLIPYASQEHRVSLSARLGLGGEGEGWKGWGTSAPGWGRVGGGGASVAFLSRIGGRVG